MLSFRPRCRIRSRCTAWPDGRTRQAGKCQSHRAFGRRTGRQRPGNRAGSAADAPDQCEPHLAGGGDDAIATESRKEPGMTRNTCCCLRSDGCGPGQPSVASKLNITEQARIQVTAILCFQTCPWTPGIKLLWVAENGLPIFCYRVSAPPWLALRHIMNIA